MTDLLNQICESYREDPSEEKLVKFIDLVFEEAKKVLLGMGIRTNVDDTAREYAIYLASRLWDGSLGEIDAWDSYITHNIKEILNCNVQRLVSLDDISDFLSSISYDDSHLYSDIEGTFVSMMRFLYSESEIKRVLPFAVSCIRSQGRKLLDSDDVPDDIKNFTKVSLVVAHKLLREKKEEKDRAVAVEDIPPALFKSTFLLAGLSSKYKELCLALSYHDLVRLAIIAGGRKLKIPTLKELDTLTTASECLWMEISSKKGRRKITSIVKDEFDYDYDVRSIDPLIEDFTVDVYKEPVFNFLSSFMKGVGKVLENLERLDLSRLTNDQIVDLYEMIVRSVSSSSRLLEMLAKMKGGSASKT